MLGKKRMQKKMHFKEKERNRLEFYQGERKGKCCQFSKKV